MLSKLYMTLCSNQGRLFYTHPNWNHFMDMFIFFLLCRVKITFSLIYCLLLLQHEKMFNSYIYMYMYIWVDISFHLQD